MTIIKEDRLQFIKQTGKQLEIVWCYSGLNEFRFWDFNHNFIGCKQFKPE